MKIEYLPLTTDPIPPQEKASLTPAELLTKYGYWTSPVRLMTRAEVEARFPSPAKQDK